MPDRGSFASSQGGQVGASNNNFRNVGGGHSSHHNLQNEQVHQGDMNNFYTHNNNINTVGGGATGSYTGGQIGNLSGASGSYTGMLSGVQNARGGSTTLGAFGQNGGTMFDNFSRKIDGI